MKSRSLQFAVFTLTLAVVSCSKNEQSSDEAADTASKDYPLTTCVVSGEALGSMGEPIVYDHNGTTVKFCCKSCIPKFEEDPETYISKLN